MEAITIREYLIKKIEAQAERKLKKAEIKVKAAENQIKTAVLNLHAKGFATEDIADIMSQPLSFVIEVLEKHFDNK